MRRPAIIAALALSTIFNSACVISDPEQQNSPRFGNFVLPAWVMSTTEGTYVGVYDHVKYKEGGKIVVKDERRITLNGNPVEAKLKGEFFCGEVEITSTGPGSGTLPLDGFIRLEDRSDPNNPKKFELLGEDARCSIELINILKKEQAKALKR